MKNLVLHSFYLFLFTLLTPVFVQAQSYSLIGDWKGALAVSGTELRIVFHVVPDGDELKATLDSPDQGAYDISCGAVTSEGENVIIIVPGVGGKYEGKFVSEKSIEGTWSQGTANLPLNLTYAEEVEELVRPQEPKPPYPYTVEDLSFENAYAEISLAGTLTIPNGEGLFPAVVLVSGSGPQDRNESLMGHKPFLVIADYLTRNGIAVLRYDDRGVGDSGGDFVKSTSMDFSTDAEAAIMYLKNRAKINPEMIGIIGHSEGGIIAPIVASRSKDVGFIVLLAGTGIKGAEIIIRQTRLISEASGVGEEEIDKTEKWQTKAFNIIRNDLDSISQHQEFEIFADDYIKSLPDEEKEIPENSKKAILDRLEVFNSPWMRFLLTYDPAQSLEKVKCPVLALNGAKDLQVPPKENLSAIETALKKGKNKNFRVQELQDLNHLFQHAETGAPSEYGKIEETFSEEALSIMSDWINALR